MKLSLADCSQSALLTDFYELTMLSAYHQLGMAETAAFEFSVRQLPDNRNFLVAAGLEQVLDYLEQLRFSASDLEWLATTGEFRPDFLTWLGDFKFTGHVEAMREGTVCFGDEPLLRITAPLAQAQFVESRIVNLLHYQTLVASKAARCRLTAGTHKLVDFGMRRAHGAEAAMLAARASYIAGFDATSNVAASRAFSIPMAGTMAHSFVQAYEHESDAFRAFANCRPNDLTLLIDTYDTIRAAQRVVDLAYELAQRGIRIANVRIDSGDLLDASIKVRSILDKGGCTHIGIFVSGGLDEYKIAKLISAGAPIDAFGVGTALTVSSDDPALDCTYKLQQYAGTPRRKSSIAKSTRPGRRQVHRIYGQDGRIGLDVVGCVDEIVEGKALLKTCMLDGRRTAPSPSLPEVRQHCADEFATLPRSLTTTDHGPSSFVKISHGLNELAEELERLAH